MGKTRVMVPLFLFFIVTIASSDRIKDEKNRKTATGPTSSSSGSPEIVNLADDPLIVHRRVNSNVKTGLRRTTTLRNTIGREPSIQAYGLVKKVTENSGEIERLSFGNRDSNLEILKVEKVTPWSREPSIQAYGLPKNVEVSNGVIERTSHEDLSSSPRFATTSNIRRVRSVDAKIAGNNLDDLEAQEAKVFRPLFVYRQQVADRYRVNRRWNPIPGAYQYGPNPNQLFRNYYY